MKYSLSYFVFIFIFSITIYAQKNVIKHDVAPGETITQIAKKYDVTVNDIYQLNPDAQSGLKPNSVLLIPKKSKDKKTKETVSTHEVLPKETLYGIEKKFGVTDEALKEANPFLEKDGLQIGQMLTIPSGSVSKKSSPTAEKAVYHDVLPKETKYSIAKQYGITVEELEKRNPEIISNLPIGYRLLIKGTPSKTDKVEVVESKTVAVVPVSAKKEVATSYVNYEVKPKETLYSLSKMADLSQEELIKLNPDLAKGVEIGMILKIPSTAAVSSATVAPTIMKSATVSSDIIPLETKKNSTVLTNQLTSETRKKMVMLLPFNLSNIASDTVNSTTERLKRDKFLNLTLDFYSGALIAIDSAKALKLPIDIKILDSKETKNSSDVSALFFLNNFKAADAVIGPFYQSHAESTAQLLGSKNIPVISPLSKDKGNAFPNLYQTIPTADVLKSAIFGYMKSKGGNIIDVIDKKKESSRQYIQQNEPTVKIVPLNESGSFSVESLKNLFVKDKINYVIIETGNTVMIKLAIKTMVDAMEIESFNVQLVVLEANETLETEEIVFENLIKLKLLYPSINRENDSPAALAFKNTYKKKNMIYPNSYATRGFDVTFDTLMRLAQGTTYQETLEPYVTEQVDNKFEFYKKEDGGYANKGVYLLYYDSDLTVKEAN